MPPRPSSSPLPSHCLPAMPLVKLLARPRHKIRTLASIHPLVYDRKGLVSAFRPKETALEAAETFRLSVSFRPKDTFRPKVLISAERGLFRPKLGAKSAHTLAEIGRNEPLLAEINTFGRNCLFRSISAFGRNNLT